MYKKDVLQKLIDANKATGFGCLGPLHIFADVSMRADPLSSGSGRPETDLYLAPDTSSRWK